MDQDEILSLIERSGVALYGERWKTALAKDLGVSYRTLQNWLEREFPVKPEEIIPKLHTKLIENHATLDHLIIEMRVKMNGMNI